MAMPIADVVQSLLVELLNFALFGLPIRDIRPPTSLIGTPRTCRPFDKNLYLGEAQESSASRLSVPTSKLPITPEVLNDCIDEDNLLF